MFCRTVTIVCVRVCVCVCVCMCVCVCVYSRKVKVRLVDAFSGGDDGGETDSFALQVAIWPHLLSSLLLDAAVLFTATGPPAPLTRLLMFVFRIWCWERRTRGQMSLLSRCSSWVQFVRFLCERVWGVGCGRMGGVD